MNHGPIVLDNPNFRDMNENKKREKVFMDVRGKYDLWAPIYKSTKWYKTKILLNDELVYGPFKPRDDELNKGNNLDLNNIILWGHEKSGPFIILEGNHRWFSRKKNKSYYVNVYVGLSKQKYYIHKITNCGKCKN